MVRPDRETAFPSEAPAPVSTSSVQSAVDDQARTVGGDGSHSCELSGSEAVVRLAEDRSLAGRVLVWWSEDAPRLIEWGDRGYRDLVDF